MPTIYQYVKSKDAHPIIQFVKYGICGGMATFVTLGTWLILSRWVNPALDGMIVDGQPISDQMRFRNSTINNAIAFVPGNLAAYLSNAVWVFHGGRHSRLREFVYFTAVSGISFGAGLIGGPLLIKWFGIATWLSQLSLIITSVLVNYVCRKFIVFKG